MNRETVTHKDFPKNKEFYTTIQVLRGAAALAVVTFHISEMLLRYTGGNGLFCKLSPIWHTGVAGVDLFFVISGFVMVQSTRTRFQQQSAGRHFIIRRLIRIVPLYWLYTTIMLILVLLPFTLKNTVFSIQYTIQSFLFIPAFDPATGLDLPLLAQGWTLSYEMYFYLLFCLLLRFPYKIFLPVISIFFFISGMAGLLLEMKDPLMKVLLNPLLLEFVLGCLLAHLLNIKNISSQAASLLLGAGILLLLFSSFIPISIDYRFISWGIPAFLITAGVVFLEKNTLLLPPRFFMLMGRNSYSTYLSHSFVLLCVGTLLKKNLVPGQISNDFTAVTSIMFCLFIGHLSYLYLEKTFTNFFLYKLE